MSNIYYWDVLKTSIFWVYKIYHQANFRGALTHGDITEF